jgi:hypothetical protein
VEEEKPHIAVSMAAVPPDKLRPARGKYMVARERVGERPIHIPMRERIYRVAVLFKLFSQRDMRGDGKRHNFRGVGERTG